MNIHCSACGAPLPTGAKFCPACALPLTAIAMPTPAPVKRPAPLWPWFLAAFLIFWIVAYTSDQVSAQHRETALAAFTAGLAANGALTTPEAFQAACGKAEIASSYKNTTELSYGDMRVYFAPGHAVDIRRIMTTELGWQQPVDTAVAFDRLQGCKELHAQ